MGVGSNNKRGSNIVILFFRIFCIRFAKTTKELIMKQYIMGMLTGASLILCAVMFMGNAQNSTDSTGKFQATTVYDAESKEILVTIIDTKKGWVTGKQYYRQSAYDLEF